MPGDLCASPGSLGALKPVYLCPFVDCDRRGAGRKDYRAILATKSPRVRLNRRSHEDHSRERLCGHEPQDGQHHICPGHSQARLRAGFGNRHHPHRRLSAAYRLVQEGRRGLLRGVHLQPGRVSRPYRRRSPELPLLHEPPVLRPHRHRQGQHPCPRRHRPGRRARLQELRPAGEGRRLRGPAAARHRSQRPHRLQRAGRRLLQGHAVRGPDALHHRGQQPPVRQPGRRAAPGLHDGRPDDHAGPHDRGGGHRRRQGPGRP